MMKRLVGTYDDQILSKDEFDDINLLSFKQYILYAPLSLLFGYKTLIGFYKRKNLTVEELGLLKRQRFCFFLFSSCLGYKFLEYQILAEDLGNKYFDEFDKYEIERFFKNGADPSTLQKIKLKHNPHLLDP